jgi:hypothetical protein
VKELSRDEQARRLVFLIEGVSDYHHERVIAVVIGALAPETPRRALAFPKMPQRAPPASTTPDVPEASNVIPFSRAGKAR